MNIRSGPEITAERIGGTCVGDVFVCIGESDGPNDTKFMLGYNYHDNQPPVRGWVKKFLDIDSDSLLERVLMHLNIPDINYTPPAKATLEELLVWLRDAIAEL
jgi:hypothetical protein